MKIVHTNPLVGRGVSRLLHHLNQHSLVSRWLSLSTNTNKIPKLQNVHDILLPFFLSIFHSATNCSLLFIIDSEKLFPILREQLLYLFPNDLAVLSSGILPSINDTHQVNLFLNKQRSHLMVGEREFVSWSLSIPNKHNLPPYISLGDCPNIPSLKRTLLSWGYEQVHSVATPGSFALRGGIFDTFPFGFVLPLRIEFFGDHIDSVRTFDPLSQRMIKTVPWSSIKIFRPVFLSQNSSDLNSLANIHSPESYFLHIQSSGPPHLYNLSSWNRNKNPLLNQFDLACFDKGSFQKNLTALEAEFSHVNKKQDVACFLLFDPPFANRVREDKVLSTFFPVCFPSQGAFSSELLNLFIISLTSVYDLPKSQLSSMPVSSRMKKTLPMSIEDFKWGEHLVHEDLGVGLYSGLSTIDTTSGLHECITLEFARGDLVHVPLDRLSKVHRYVGPTSAKPTLTNLKTTHWQRLKQQTRRSAEKIVQEFIDLYAERFKATGYPFSPDTELHAHLIGSFPYDETDDQLTSYDAIRKDMESDRPMDRLLCGDVGFGKTEVAVRAAFKAVYDKKQVVVLAPTTILANQHYLTFRGRLESLSVKVAHLSRFTTEQRVKRILKDLSWGFIDVIIGTHRLLSSDVNIPKLGLLIIDEEHRFGARHKEVLKALRRSIDVLSMSATPIPRTLQFSLLGVRDISTISTPPLERIPIITSVSQFSKSLITKAVHMEIERQGQVFFIHNRVKTINKIAEKIQELFPSLSIGVAHGQMPDKALEDIMIDFLEKRIHILVCTTIVEAGIDLPNVNTIFINNAHQFGLSQLYQMRGRVGRSDRQAYCYLLTPSNKRLTPSALERLRTVQYYSSLGSGYSVALKDLQMRGAGNLFGVEQTGHLNSVGYHLYCKIVEEVAKRKLHKVSLEDEFSPVRIKINADTLIPSSYVSDVGDRLSLYRRLGMAESVIELNDLKDEVRDRFGPLPIETGNLFMLANARIITQGTGLKELVLSRHKVRGVFDKPESNSSTVQLTKLLEKRLSTLRLSFHFSSDPEGGLQFTADIASLNDGMRTIEYLFESTCVPPNFPRLQSSAEP